MANENVVSLLRADAAGARRQVKMSLGVGIGLVLVVFAYLQWAFSAIRIVFDPDELASFSVNYGRDQLNHVIDEVTRSAEEGVLDNVASGYDAIDAAVTNGREKALGELVAVDADLGRALQSWLDESMSRVIAEDKALKAALAKDPRNVPPAVLAGLRKKIRAEAEAAFGATVDAELNSATKSLTSLRERVERYAGKGGLTPEEREERDLLVAFFQLSEVDLTHMLEADALQGL